MDFGMQVWDAIQDGLLDTVKLVPFLFLTYLVMEYIEHHTSDKTKAVIRRADRFGPLAGGLLGAFPPALSEGRASCGGL